MPAPTLVAGAPCWNDLFSSDTERAKDRTVAAARANGGHVLLEPMDVTRNGRFAMVADPGGATIGAWQPREVTGFELHTREYDASVACYRDVFG